MATHDVFLSYPGNSERDLADVRALRAALLEHGFAPWVAGLELRDSAAMHEQTMKALREANAFIACIGNAEPGRWAQREAEEAHRRAASEPAFIACTVLLPGSQTRDVRLRSPGFADWPSVDLRNGFAVIDPLLAVLEYGRLLPSQREICARVVRALRSRQRVLLTGIAGNGKTRIARTAALELATDFPEGSVQVRCGGGRSVAEIASEILYGLGHGRQEPLHVLEQYRRLLGRGRHLVVLDDPDEEQLRTLVPPEPSSLIATSRRRLKAPGATVITVRTPPIQETHELARRLGIGPPLLNELAVTPNLTPLQVRLLAARGRPPADDDARDAPRALPQPGFASDVPTGEDMLEIEEGVAALCSVVAARDVAPPLSIGLFGDWGTGKTFFIEKMRARIAELSEASAGAERTAYCRAVKQIVFNAWHYADANLWASLATRVFEGLAESDGDDSNDGRLVAELASSQAQLREAEHARERASERVERALRAEREAREGIAQAREDLDRVRARDLFAALGDDPAAQRELSQLAALVGLPEETTTATARTVADLQTIGGSARELWRRAPLLLLATLALVVATALLSLLVPDWPAKAAAGAVALGSVLALLAGPLRAVARAMGLARRIAREAAVRQEELRHGEERELQARLELLREEERAAVRRVEQAESRIEQAEEAIEDIRSGRRLFRFIEERAGGDAYQAYLGVVARVRQDFERLAELLRERNGDGDGGGGLPDIDRIVLYVDDLDRCPADRVIEVLEAVHLLMASELFVVVVAVDPRWLLRALERHYEREMAPSTADGAGPLAWAPTPQDYLEKIFQIPFSLPPMEAAGFDRLVTSLFPEQAATGGADVERDDITPPSRLDAAPAASRDEPTHPTPPSVPEPVRPLVTIAPANLRPAGLMVEEPELVFMRRLAGLIRTPRSAKRLANLYRLLRAPLSAAELERFTGAGGRPPEYPAVQLLLAIVVGYPGVAPELFAAIAAREKDDWSTLVRRWWPRGGTHSAAWSRVRSGLAPLEGEPLPPLDVFARWAPRVARYSFGMQLTAAEPPAEPPAEPSAEPSVT